MAIQRALRAAIGLGLTASLGASLTGGALEAAPRFGGGGYRYGGGRTPYHFNNTGFRSGYQGYHPMYGPDSRTNWNSNNRTNWNSDNRTNGNFDNDRFNRTVNVNNNFYNRDYNGWNRSWANGGYWNSRPWATGWYRGGSGWGWWGSSAAAWGMAGLATGAVIGSLVNAASDAQSPVIMVPNTTYELNYGSVEGVGSYGVSFNYLVNGTQLMGAANCQQGLLNGQIPTNASQAQLLNAVCQVAYGSGS